MGKKRIVKKGGESGAEAAGSSTQKTGGKRKLETGVLYVEATYNNTKVSLTDPQGNLVAWSSAGSLGFNGAKKGTPFAAAKVGELLGERAAGFGVKQVSVVVSGVGAGRESSIRAFSTKGIHISAIKDTTPVPHNGPRAQSPPRLVITRKLVSTIYMLIGPKYKICKRLGSSVFEKCQTQKFQLAEARAPRRTTRGRRGGSDFGAQLLEKQKARFTYGLSENQFSRYAHEAMEGKGSAATGLLSRLESRLDNVIYRAGFVKTRRAARQLVGHGHVLVNGKRLNIPSYQVQVGDVISIRPESRPSALFTGRTESVSEVKAPAWMTLEEEGFAARIGAVPAMEETSAPFSAATIIQFYSR